MGADMLIHIVALPDGKLPDLDAALATATALARGATWKQVRAFAEGYGDEPDHAPADVRRMDADTFARHADVLRQWVQRRLHLLLHEFTESLHHRDVTCLPLAATGHTGGVCVYLTGGLSWGEEPTGTYLVWDTLLDLNQQHLPAGWADRLAAALGLLHPHGHGPPLATTRWHRWQ